MKLRFKLVKSLRILAVAFVIAIVFSIGVFNFPVGAVTRELYWFGGSGNWGDTAHWSLSSGNGDSSAPQAVPDTDDNVHFDANSGSGIWTTTVNVTAYCHDMDWIGVLGTAKFKSQGSGTGKTNISGSVTLASNVIFGTDLSWGVANFTATSGTEYFTFNGGTVEGQVFFTGSGGTFNIVDSGTFGDVVVVKNGVTLVFSPGITIAIGSTYGQFDVWGGGAIQLNSAAITIQKVGGIGTTNDGWVVDVGASVSCGTSSITVTSNLPFAGGGNTYYDVSLTGTGSYSITGNNNYHNLSIAGANFTLSTNSTISGTLTMSGSTPTISGINRITTLNVSGATATVSGAQTVSGTASFTGGTPSITAACSFGNLTITGLAIKTDTVTLGANQTITGTLTLNGNSSINRLLVKSDTATTARTLTVTTLIVSSYVDFLDITGVSAGAASWDLSAITGGSGDLGHNTGITFTTASSQYWSNAANTGNWSDPTKWASTSGGVGGTGHMPLVQDIATFDASSFSVASRTVTVDVSYIGNINTIDIDESTTNIYSASTINSYAKSIDLGSHSFTTVSGLYIYGRSDPTYNSVGTTITGALYSYTYTGSTFMLYSDMAVTGAIYLMAGTLDFYTWDVTANNFDSTTTTYARVLTLGTGWFTLNGTGAISKWAVDTGGAGLTVSSNTSTIECVNAGANGQTFAGGSVVTYNNLKISGAGNYIFTFTGTNTFNTIYVDRSLAAKTIAGNVTQTISQMTIPIAGTTMVTITNTDFTKTSGIFSSDYLTISGSTVTAATFYACTHSVDNGGNANWNFTCYANPVVSTWSVSGVDDFSGVLNGVLDGLGTYSTVYVYFQWGTTAGYGYTTVEQTLSAVAAYNKIISGLSSGTVYHYRAACRYYVGAVATFTYGNDMTFKTTSTAGAPVVITGSAVAVDATTATLVGSLISVGDYSLSTIAVAFDYCTDGLFGAGTLTTGYQTLTALTTYTEDITGLTSNTTYYFRAKVLYILGSTDRYAYGGSVTFVTLSASGSSTTITVVAGTAAVFSGYLDTTGTKDLLFCAEVVNTYIGYYPNKPASQYFQIQLLDPTGVNILGAVPLWDYGTVPVSIYFNQTDATAFTYEGAYQIKMTGLFASPPTSTVTLTPADWKGDDLNNLDSWMRSVAVDINTNNNWTFLNTSQYTLANVTDITKPILSDNGGFFFTSGIPGVSSVRPNMFTQSKSAPSIFSGTSNNVFDTQTWVTGSSYAINDLSVDSSIIYRCKVAVSPSILLPSADAANWEVYTTWVAMTPYTLDEVEYFNGLAYYCKLAYSGGAANPPADAAHWTLIAYPVWVAQVGTKIASDATVFGSTFGITGNIFIGYGIWALIVIITLIGASKGAGALGTVMLCIPLILIGNYFRVIAIQWTIVAMVICVILFVRQIWFKTT